MKHCLCRIKWIPVSSRMAAEAAVWLMSYYLLLISSLLLGVNRLSCVYRRHSLGFDSLPTGWQSRSIRQPQRVSTAASLRQSLHSKPHSSSSHSDIHLSSRFLFTHPTSNSSCFQQQKLIQSYCSKQIDSGYCVTEHVVCLWLLTVSWFISCQQNHQMLEEAATFKMTFVIRQ